jgi:hypothetical protein
MSAASTGRSKGKRLLFSLALIFIIFLGTGAALEIGTRILFRGDNFNKTIKDIQDRKLSLGPLNLGEDCRFAQTVIPHPFLALIHTKTGRCGLSHINAQGFQDSYDYPEVKDDRYFSVLVLGGSVAHQISTNQWGFGQHLSKELKKIRSPNGKPWRVHTGGIGGWRMPNQIMMATLYGQKFDAIISIDGANESTRQYPLKLEVPELPIFIYHLNLGGLREVLDGLYRVQSWGRKIAELPILNKSQAVLRGYLALDAYFSKSIASQYEEVAKAYYPDFFFPAGVSAEAALSQNIARYLSHIRDLHSIASGRRQKFLHVFQPTLATKMNKVGAEKEAQPWSSADYYQRWASDYERFRLAGRIPMLNLSRIFDRSNQEIFVDAVHCKTTDDYSLGYELMAQEIVKNIKKTWY